MRGGIAVPLALRVVQPATQAEGGDDLGGKYLGQLLDGAGNIRVELRMVDPEWAAAKLAECNTANRPQSDGTVRGIQAAIERGAWRLNGETIVFDRGGKLVQGQHRLNGVVRSGIAVSCLVVYGVDPEAFATYDQTKRRNTADICGILGQTNYTTLASCLGWLRAYHSGGKMRAAIYRPFPNDLVAGTLASYPGVGESVVWAREKIKGKSPSLSPSVAAFLHYLLTGIDRDTAEPFFRCVVEGLDVKEGSHEAVLRDRLSSVADGADRSMLGARVKTAALVIKVWNKIRAGQPPLKVLKWDADTEEFPKAK